MQNKNNSKWYMLRAEHASFIIRFLLPPIPPPVGLVEAHLPAQPAGADITNASRH
jgi:hypothetical protein